MTPITSPPSAQTPLRRRSFVRRLALITALSLGGLMIGTLLVEIGLRLAGISFPTFMRLDHEIGASLRPGTAGWWTKEGRAFVKINQAGWRDRDHALAKPPGTFRIAVLGDSYVEAKQVALEDTFWWRMEQELRTCQSFGGRPVEVLAFGASGYGTAQEWLTLGHRVWPYEPDLVILAFLTANDVRNNSRALDREPLRPYYQMADEQLVEDFAFRTTWSFVFRTSFVGQMLESLIRSSRVAQLVNESVKVISERRRLSTSTPPPQPSFMEAGVDLDVYRVPTDPVWKEAWAVTERLLLEMQRQVQAHGAAFHLVTLSNGPQVYPDPALRTSFAASLGVPDLFYPDDRVARLAAGAGIPLLSLVRPLQAYADRDGVFLHGFTNSGVGVGHWNEAGHREAGRLLAEHVCRQVAP